jgi:predicted alpha/beta superfamily hydrolase
MRLLILILLSFSFFTAKAQDYSATTLRHSFESDAFAKERTIEIYIPYAYTESTDQKAMVIYVFDGQFEPFFDMAAATADYLHAIGELPLFIAVGIHTENRPREFTPAPNHADTRTGWGEESQIGNSALLDRHLKEEVMPYIESNYRTRPINFAIGHSLGGTYVTNDVLTNHLFKGVISISPNTQYDHNQLVSKADSLLSGGNAPKAFHFMTAGTVGRMENSFRRASDMLDSTYQAHPSPDLKWHYHTYQDQGHSITPMRSIGEGLMAFSKLLVLDDSTALAYLNDSSQPFVKDISDHYGKLSEWLEFDFELSVDEWNNPGYVAMGEENYAEALQVFELAVAKYPDDANIHDSRGEALENLGKHAAALESYQKAVETLEAKRDKMDQETFDYYHEMFLANRDRMKEVLEER